MISVAICVFLLVVAFGFAIRGISRIEATGPARNELVTADELLHLERELAEHGSFGRNFADREVV